MTCPPAARRVGALSALALVFVLTACGDSTAPLFGTRVKISVESIDGPIMFEDVPGEPRIRCAVTFRATGAGGESATWYGATFKFFAGPDRSAPLDSTILYAGDIGDSWGGMTLRDGQSVESEWIFESGAPFVVTADYRYLPAAGAAVARASARFACGPEPSANSPLPTITNVSLTVPPDGLEPGDTLVVSYTASASLGVWATAIEFSGACEKFVEFGERLEMTASRTRWVPVPADCVLNAPLSVTVYAADGALRLVSLPFPGPILVDHTPPMLDVGFFPPDGGGLSTDIGGLYFVGDTIDLLVWARDNNVVRSIIYEMLPLGRRDSIVVGAPFDGRLRLPVPPDATGSMQLRLYARDARGLTSSPFTTQPGSIQVYPTIDRPTLQTSFDGMVSDIAIDAERGAIYVLQLNEWRIRVFSATTLEMTQTITLPYGTSSLDVTPSGDSLIVIHRQGLGVIDLRQATPVLSVIPLTLDASAGQRAASVVVLENGRAFVALSGNAPRANALLEVSLATGEQRTRTDAADASSVAFASSLQRSPDRRAFIFNGGPGHFRRYDATTDQFTPGGTAVQHSGMLSLDRAGQHNSVGLDIYDASLTFVRRVESIYGAMTLVPATTLSADGEYLYIGGRRGVMRSRVSDGRVVDRTLNPIPALMFRVASDDSFLVTATQIGAAQLSLIRMR